MEICINCNVRKPWNKRSHLCSKCLKKIVKGWENDEQKAV